MLALLTALAQALVEFLRLKTRPLPMTYSAESRMTRTPTRSSWALCVLGLTISASGGLTSCAHDSSAPPASLRIYQPRVLLLKAGQPVQTPQGVYTPQTDEVWHSAQAFADLEAQALNAATALTEEHNRISK